MRYTQEQMKQLTRRMIAQGQFADRTMRETVELAARAAAREEARAALRREVIIGQLILRRATATVKAAAKATAKRAARVKK